MTAAGRDYDGDRPVACGDCQWQGKESDLNEILEDIPQLNERLTSGDPSPAGLCPNTDPDTCCLGTSTTGSDGVCGSFVYFNDIEICYRVKPTVLEALAECAPRKRVKK
jgi:hypothetical protein